MTVTDHLLNAYICPASRNNVHKATIFKGIMI